MPSPKPLLCDDCPIRSHSPYWVPPGVVRSDTRLAVWGESAGQEEEAQGYGFVGASGKLLRTWLRRAGLVAASGWGEDTPANRREDVAFFNAVSCRPLGNKWPGMEVASRCLEIHQDLASGGVGGVVSACPTPNGRVLAGTTTPLLGVPWYALGANAVEALTGIRFKEFLKVRGSVLPTRWEGKWLVAGIHPAFLVRGGGDSNPGGEEGKAQDHLTPLLGADCRRALTCPTPRVPKIALVRDLTQLPAFKGQVALDIEGAGGQPRIVGLGVEGRAYVMDWSDDVRAYLGRLWTRGVVPVLHNASYDIPELTQAGVEAPEEWDDTINIACLYDPSLPMNLQSQVLTHVPGSTTWKRLVDHKRGADYEGGEAGVYRSLWSRILGGLGRFVPVGGHDWECFYNGLDTAWTLELYLALRRGLVAQGRWHYYETVIRPLQRPLLEMGLRGMPVDVAELARLREECQAKLDAANAHLAGQGAEVQAERRKALEGEIHSLELERMGERAAGQRAFSRAKELTSLRNRLKSIPTDFNSESNPQRQALLYDWYGLPPIARRGRKGPTTDDEALLELKSRLERGTAKPKRGTVEEVRGVLDALIEAGKWSTWIGNFLTPPLRRTAAGTWLPTNYALHRTDTGRLSSGMDTSDPDKGERPKVAQVQNIPKELRGAFVAPPGMAWVGGDWTALQLALFLWAAERVERSGFHADLLARLRAGGFDPHRYLASVAHGCTEDAVEPEWRKNCKQYTFGLLFLGSPVSLSRKAGHSDKVGRDMGLAHERAFRPKKWGDATLAQVKKRHYVETPLGWRRYFWSWNPKETEVLATLIQGMEGDLFKWVLARMVPEMPKGWLLGTVTHDFIGLLTPERETARAAGWLKGQMEQPVPWLEGHSWLASVRVGRTWGEVS